MLLDGPLTKALAVKRAFWPPIQSVPSDFNASKSKSLAASSTQLLPGSSCLGSRLSFPCVLSRSSPHSQRVPLVFKAKLLNPPAAIFPQSRSRPTWVSARRGFLVPSPTWPCGLSPQAHRVPFLFKARQCPLPALIRTQSVSLPTRVGRSSWSGLT